MRSTIIAIAVLALVSTHDLSAQSAPAEKQPPVRPAAPQKVPAAQRGYVFLGGGYSIGANDFTEQTSSRANAEDGSRRVEYSVAGGPGFTVGSGVRLWKQLGMRVGISRFSLSTPAALELSVPHPFFFNRPRTTSGSVEGLSREELSVTLSAAGTMALGRRMVISLFAGPSWLQISQGTVTAVAYSDTYPYDSIALGPVTTKQNSASKVAFGAGADLSIYLSKRFGVAATAQFSRATVDLPSGESTTQIRAGGPRVGLGVVLKIP